MGDMGRMGSGMMDGMEGTVVSSEADYITRMIPHHQEAIASAEVLLANTDDPELKRLGETIVRTQTAELERLRGWLSAYYPEQPAAEYQPMMRELAGLSDEALERVFLEDMTLHHGMAVMMSQSLLSQDLVIHEPLRAFAQGVRDNQHAEMMSMMRLSMSGMGSMSGGQ